uniref:xaa-Pro aminopeptidase 1-like n=1 Tax=Styela clava TaxID=7725 RepID=UPI00193A4466|nr:xaa-Pro aminopeptidase 1-like [Styela clava]
MKVKDTTQILQNIRRVMISGECSSAPLEAIIIPSSDAHQSEYLAPCDLRRNFVSGFTGSAGTAVITQEKAALWTDGRYFLQAERELDNSWMLMRIGVKETPSIEDWLNSTLPPKSNVGVNPLLYANRSWNAMKKKLQVKGHSLLATKSDVVDAIWKDKPVKPYNALILLDDETTGMSMGEKIASLRDKMLQNSTKWLILTALDDIAWVLNMRGSDVEFNPVFFAYLIIGESSVEVFIDKNLVTEKVSTHLNSQVKINVHDYDFALEFIQQHCATADVWLTSGSSYAIVSSINENHRVMAANSPVALMKAIKNMREIKGMKAANVRDAVALCQYLHWLETEVVKGGVTECSAAKKSLHFRQQQDKFVSLSFGTISSSGSTGSIIHYTPSEDADRPVTASEIYLCDSGAQYLDGTTDTTRTVHFGNPSEYEKECFTRVLKGHIALALIVFPAGTKGYMLDTLARMHLWKAGLDYMHGTGHGVGTFLNVHEGPVGIYIGNSSRVVQVASETELAPGMIITDEPGYYENGKFGIRIENALLCTNAQTAYNFAGKKFFKFEPIAYVPIQKKMIKKELLSGDEIQWLNDYHARCLEIVGRELKSQGHTETLKWLEQQTTPV